MKPRSFQIYSTVICEMYGETWVQKKKKIMSVFGNMKTKRLDRGGNDEINYGY